MHAALCIPSVTGAWLHEGGGGFHNNGAIYPLEQVADRRPATSPIPACACSTSRRIGPVLTGDPHDLKGGPPVTALFIQNMNPVQVAPEQRKVKAGFAREDLFTCVHEQFMTATAKMADVVLPATMFLEHDDVYQGGGHQHIMLGPKLIEPPGECRSNHDVICALAKRVGAEHPRLRHDARARSSTGRCRSRAGARWPSWKRRSGSTASRSSTRRTTSTASAIPTRSSASSRTGRTCRRRAATASGHRARGAAPARPLGRDREGRREASVPARDQPVARLSQLVVQRDADQPARGTASRASRCIPTIWRRSASPTARACAWATSAARSCWRPRPSPGVQRGVVIVESIAPNDHFEGGEGINTLTSAYPGRALRRRGLPRQPRVDRESVSATMRRAARLAMAASTAGVWADGGVRR